MVLFYFTHHIGYTSLLNLKFFSISDVLYRIGADRSISDLRIPSEGSQIKKYHFIRVCILMLSKARARKNINSFEKMNICVFSIFRIYTSDHKQRSLQFPFRNRAVRFFQNSSESFGIDVKRSIMMPSTRSIQ